MISIAIIAGLVSMIWVSIDNTFETRDFMNKRFEKYQTARVAMARLKRELSSAYLAGVEHGGEKLPGKTFDEKDKGQKDKKDKDDEQKKRRQRQRQEPLQFGMKGDEDEIHFTTLGHQRRLDGERASFHAEISYFTESKRRNGELVDSLMRREDTTIDDDIEDGGTIFTMIPRLEEIEFEYWDSGDLKLGTKEEIAEEGKWIDEWDTTSSRFSGRLPSRIRITITLPPATAQGTELSFTTQTQLGITQVLEF